MLKVLIALALMTAPGTALAQAAMCRIPSQPERPKPEGPTKEEPRRVLPIGSYTLAISWSPQYCSTASRGGNSFQCSGRNGKFAFTLHGLWPDGIGKQWPQYCRSADLLPRKVVQENLCTTPSAQLLQHEWAKHGTCMTTKPELYFNLSRTFFHSLRFPDMAALSRRETLTAGEFAEAFARANKGIKANMMRVTTTRENWLSEVWLCMDKQMEFTRCPAHQGGVSPSSSLRIASGPIIRHTGPTPPPGFVPPAAPLTEKTVPRPARRPSLILDLDPNAQPIADKADKPD